MLNLNGNNGVPRLKPRHRVLFSEYNAPEQAPSGRDADSPPPLPRHGLQPHPPPQGTRDETPEEGEDAVAVVNHPDVAAAADGADDVA